MDEKFLLRKSLAKIMVDVLPEINSLYKKYPQAFPTLKEDGTPVTTLDLAISELLERKLVQSFPDATIYSEENYSTWGFPLMAIDPLDGTKEYVINRPEWAVSIGHINSSDFSGEGWVYNPAFKELFSVTQKGWAHVEKPEYYGEVSHTEWNNNLFQEKSQKFKIGPKGSIAYKLGRLSLGAIDFVVSLAPKNIWDIAGGTLLCKKSNIKFYAQGKEVTEVKQLYYPPLIWCHEELFSELSELFPLKDKYP